MNELISINKLTRATRRSNELLMFGLVAVAGLALLTGNIPGMTGGLFATQQITGSTVDGEAYNFGMTYQESNALSGASYTGTSSSYNLIQSNGQRLASVNSLYGTASLVNVASGTTATEIPVYNNIIFINIDTGTAHFPDVSQIMQNNQFLTDFAWLPVSSANVPELVVEADLSKVGSPNLNVDPSISAKLLVAGIPEDTGASMSSPADQTGIGTTQTDVYINWEITGLSASEGFSIARMWLTSNQTASELEILDVTIDTSSYIIDMGNGNNLGEDYVIGSPPATAQTSGGITQFWRFVPGASDVSTDYSDTLVIPRGASDADSIIIRVHGRTTFAGGGTGHSLTAVMNLRVISAGNALQTTVQDSVTLTQ